MAQLQAYFRENIDRYTTPETVSLEHVVFPWGEEISEEELATGLIDGEQVHEAGAGNMEHLRIAALLAEELGTDPTAETFALRDHIAQMRDKGVRPFAPTANSPLVDAERRIPLVGRRDQRMVALRRLEDALSGRGGVLLIEGDAGIEGTVQVDAALDLGHGQHVPV